MARRKEDPPKGSPAWMNTFADLMNLLLCFFVMLFSMSSVNEEKFEKVIASFQSTFSILPGGGASIGEGELISSGISQLENFDSYYNQQLSSQSDGQTEEEKDITEAYEQQELEESEDMAQQLENALSQYGIQDDVEVDFNAEYVTLNMNGALLFDSASAELRDEAYPLVNKLGKILVTIITSLRSRDTRTMCRFILPSMRTTTYCPCTVRLRLPTICGIPQHWILHT